VPVVPFDDLLCRAASELCGHAGTADVIDASLVIVARQYDGAIIAGDSVICDASIRAVI
jgi:hypothetical protein